MDGLDRFRSSVFGFASGEATLGSSTAPALPAPAPAPQDELDALLALVPRACRSDARWAVPLLLNTARSGGITHLRRIAYVLATAQHSAAFGAVLEERATGRDAGAPGYAKHEPGTPLGQALGNTQPGDGERFRGRGFVPVRGRTAYTTWSQRLCMPEQIVNGSPMPYFLAYPAALAQPNIAAQTLVRGMRDGLFTGVALGSYVNDKKTDYYSARRVIDTADRGREIAETALAFAHALEDVQSNRHRERMQLLTDLRAAKTGRRDLMLEVRSAVERLAQRGEIMPAPLEVIEWNGEARQGKFVQLDEVTCALHIGRGTYMRLDVQQDLNGIVPPEARNMALKRSGDVRAAVRHGDVNFWS